MLDVQMLKAMPDGCIFATGEGLIPELHSQKEVRWIAKRGDGAWDWAIYYHLINKSVSFIEQQGDKVFTDSTIKKLIPCDEESLKIYRK